VVFERHHTIVLFGEMDGSSSFLLVLERATNLCSQIVTIPKAEMSQIARLATETPKKTFRLSCLRKNDKS